MVTVNVVVLAGTIATDPVQRRMPSGDEVTELRLSVPEAGKRLLPLPVAAWHATVGARTVDGIAKGDAVLVHDHLVRRFYRSRSGSEEPHGGGGDRDQEARAAGRLRAAGYPLSALGPAALAKLCGGCRSGR
jgi:hypothetical protein